MLDADIPLREATMTKEDNPQTRTRDILGGGHDSKVLIVISMSPHRLRPGLGRDDADRATQNTGV